MSLELLLILVPVIALIAAAYASVGLGGGTGYLAVLTLVGMPAESMVPTALLLNLVVTGAALLRFGLAGRLPARLFFPFLLPAVPAAFLGGLIVADREVFLTLLALALAAAGIAMLATRAPAPDGIRRPARPRLLAVALPSGAAIGLLSGFLGIGGGVFLGPLVLLLRWAGPREVAAMNSAFILVLSSAALAAHGMRGSVEPGIALPLAGAALVGGLAGATLAEKKLSARALQRVFGVIILVAAAKAACDALL